MINPVNFKMATTPGKEFSMATWTATMAAAVILLGFSASASSVSEVKGKMKTAREALTASLEKKKNDEATLQAIQKTGDEVGVAIDSLKAPAGKEAVLAELKTNWKEFKSNRDGKLKDFIKSGQFDEAQKLATGRQKELLDKMNAAFEKLSGGGI